MKKEFELIIHDFGSLTSQVLLQSEDLKQLTEMKDRLELFFGRGGIKLEVEINEIEYPPCILCGEPMPKGFDVCPACVEEREK